ncbi:MAG: hypothetical protein ACNA7J_05085 [Wenzhouxiangella sp.]
MSTQQVTVTITGNAPGYQVTLNPAGPYSFSEPNSSLVLALDQATSSAGFRMVGIGFAGTYHGGSTAEAESQLCAHIESVNGNQDTLNVTDAVSENGQFEFVLLYQDSAGTIYGLDPDILNDYD